MSVLSIKLSKENLPKINTKMDTILDDVTVDFAIKEIREFRNSTEDVYVVLIDDEEYFMLEGDMTRRFRYVNTLIPGEFSQMKQW